MEALRLYVCLQIVSTCKRIDELIDRLPVVADGEEAQLRRIAALQVRGIPVSSLRCSPG